MNAEAEANPQVDVVWSAFPSATRILSTANLRATPVPTARPPLQGPGAGRQVATDVDAKPAFAEVGRVFPHHGEAKDVTPRPEVEQAIYEEVEKLKETGGSGGELQKVKKQLRGLMNTANSRQRAHPDAIALLRRLRWTGGPSMRTAQVSGGDGC